MVRYEMPVFDAHTSGLSSCPNEKKLGACQGKRRALLLLREQASPSGSTGGRELGSRWWPQRATRRPNSGATTSLATKTLVEQWTTSFLLETTAGLV